MRDLLVTCISVLCLSALADEHSCPEDRPYPRGSTACDSCPWEETFEKWQEGVLGETRPSSLFKPLSIFVDSNDLNFPFSVH